MYSVGACRRGFSQAGGTPEYVYFSDPDATEEGESRIRLTWARVLDAAGEHERARTELAKAAERLLARAAAISDPELRASFLRGIPENARTLEAAGG